MRSQLIRQLFDDGAFRTALLRSPVVRKQLLAGARFGADDDEADTTPGLGPTEGRRTEGADILVEVEE